MLTRSERNVQQKSALSRRPVFLTPLAPIGMNIQMAAITVHPLNDYLIYFFAGRQPGERYARDWNWLDDAAMKLGVGTYAIHNGNEAIVYDTFATVPQARFVRDHLENIGIEKFTVVHSHWHLDHIAGDAIYEDSDVVATSLTRDALVRQKTDIESGAVWGPPPIVPLRLPNITFDERMELAVGDIRLELRRMNIHSVDGCVIYLPKDRLLLAGDTVEDTLTYMVEVENLADHIESLKDMQQWDIAKILPNHGDPDTIVNGGYDKSLIDATVIYVTNMLAKAHDAGYLEGTMADYVGEEAAKGWVHLFEPYRDVHAQNLKLVHDYWKDKRLPVIAP